MTARRASQGRGGKDHGLDRHRLPALGRLPLAALGEGHRPAAQARRRLALQRLPHQAARRAVGTGEGRRRGRVVEASRRELPRPRGLPRPRVRAVVRSISCRRAATFRDMTADDVPAGLPSAGRAAGTRPRPTGACSWSPPSVFRAADRRARRRRLGGRHGLRRCAWPGSAWCSWTGPSADSGLGTRLVEQVLGAPAGGAERSASTPRRRASPVYARLGFEPSASLARLLATSGEHDGARGLGVRATHDRGRSARVLSARPRGLRGRPRAGPAYALTPRPRSTRGASGERRDPSAYGFGPARRRRRADRPRGRRDRRTRRASVVGACLGARPGRRFFLDAPAWPEWRPALADLGFREQRPFTRMYRGGRSPTATAGTVPRGLRPGVRMRLAAAVLLGLLPWPAAPAPRATTAAHLPRRHRARDRGRRGPRPAGDAGPRLRAARTSPSPRRASRRSSPPSRPWTSRPPARRTRRRAALPALRPSSNVGGAALGRSFVDRLRRAAPEPRRGAARARGGGRVPEDRGGRPRPRHPRGHRRRDLLDGAHSRGPGGPPAGPRPPSGPAHPRGRPGRDVATTRPCASSASAIPS